LLVRSPRLSVAPPGYPTRDGAESQPGARALPPAQATQVAGAVRQRVAAMAAGLMSTAVDEAVTAELAPLLAALRCRLLACHPGRDRRATTWAGAALRVPAQERPQH